MSFLLNLDNIALNTHTHTRIYIYIYMYMCVFSSPDRLFLVSQLFSVARHVGRLKLGLKPAQLNVRLSIRPLGQQTYRVG